MSRCIPLAATLAAPLLIVAASLAPAADLTNATLAFENTAGWAGATPDPTIKREGLTSGAWTDTVKVNRLRYQLSGGLDLSNYETVSFWAHSSAANGAILALVLVSNDPTTEGDDNYRYNFTVDWTGWKQFSIPLSDFKAIRTPLGLNQIDQIVFASEGYACGDPKPDTAIRLDDMRFLGRGRSAGELDWRAFDGVSVGQALADEGTVLLYFRSKDMPLCTDFERSYLLTPQAASMLQGRTLYFVETTTMPLIARQYKVVRVPALVLVGPGDKREMLSVQETTNPVDISKFLAGAATAGQQRGAPAQ